RWYVWRGVTGFYYARIPGISPQRVLRAPTPELLRDEILFSGAPYRSVALSRFPGFFAFSRPATHTPLRSEPLAMKRLLDPPALRALARGCAVLGAGGHRRPCPGPPR